MRVKFIGNPVNPSDNRGYVDWAGVRFPLNVAVELPEGKAYAKIPQNGHFQIVEDVPEEQAPAPVQPEITTVDEKAELIAFAEEHGVKIDKRWSIAKITAAIEDAAAKAAEGSEE